jgi:hypothetical protein
VHALGCLFVDTTHKLQKKSFFDNFVTVYGGRYALYQPRIYVIRVDHALELIKLRFGQRAEECLSILFALLLFSANISATLGEIKIL